MNKVVHFEILIDNLNRAKKFYESVFNVKFYNVESPGIEMWVFPGNDNAYGTHGSLVKMSGFPAGRNSVIVYFSCEDCQVEENLVKQFGGKVEKTKFAIGKNGFIALARDTEGNVFGLHSFK